MSCFRSNKDRGLRLPNHLCGQIKPGLPLPHPSWEVARTTCPCPSTSTLVVSRARIRNSTLLPFLNAPLPLQPLDLHLNWRLQVLRMIVRVRQVVPSSRLPSWKWTLAQRRTQTQGREVTRAVSIHE